MYQYFFWTFFKYWGTQSLDNIMSQLRQFWCECPYFHFLTDLSGDPDQFASNADSSYVSGKQHKGDLLLKWRNCYFTFVGDLWILFHVNCHPDCFYICSREIFISLLTLLLYRVISKLINYWWWFKFTCQGTLLLRYHWARL